MKWRMRLIAAAGAMILSGALAFAQTPDQIASLRQISMGLAQRQAAEEGLAKAWARANGVASRFSDATGHIWEIARIDRGQPIYRQTDNLTAMISVSADKVKAAAGLGFDLSGLGVDLGIWDGGAVRATHQEFGGRVTVMNAVALSSHATHVAGTMVARGANASAFGMSHRATLQSYDWNSDKAEMAAAAAAGLRVSNHSYGFITGWAYGNYSGSTNWHWFGDAGVSQTEDSSFGFYTGESAAWDQIAFNAPYYLPVKSAGNDRGQGPTTVTGLYWNGSAWVANPVLRDRDGGATGHDSIAEAGVGKNVLTVGAVLDLPTGYSGPSSVQMTTFSGWGPTDDGRIKPDVVGNGHGLFSSVSSSDTAYGTSSGTSMSAPNVSGTLGLLIEHYRATHSGQDMRAASLKGLAIHTAHESGAADGPDYTYGWGLLNAYGAAQTISQDALLDTIQEGVLSQGQTLDIPVYSSGMGPLKATLSWTDFQGTPTGPALDPQTRMLVNDLDIRLIAGTTTHEPWTLDPANPSAAAAKGDNDRDNVEQVLAASVPAGWHTIRVTHKGTLRGSLQAFSLIVTGQAAAPLPQISSLSLNPASVTGGASSTGTVALSLPAGPSGVSVSLASDSASASVPSTVTVPAGQSSAQFTVSTSSVAAAASALISASANGSSASAGLTLNPAVSNAKLASVTVSPLRFPWWQGATGTVTLTDAAPVGGALVSLSATNANPTLPATVLVPEGQTSAAFAIGSSAANPSQNLSFRVRATWKGLTKTSATVVIEAVKLGSIAASSTVLTSGQTATITVSLTSAAPPGGAVVNLALGSAYLTGPSSVTIPQGSKTAVFTVQAATVTRQRTTRIAATWNGITRSIRITINP